MQMPIENFCVRSRAEWRMIYQAAEIKEEELNSFQACVHFGEAHINYWKKLLELQAQESPTEELDHFLAAANHAILSVPGLRPKHRQILIYNYEYYLTLRVMMGETQAELFARDNSEYFPPEYPSSVNYKPSSFEWLHPDIVARKNKG